MVVEFVKRFEKELKNAPRDIQKRVILIVEKLQAASSLETAEVDYKKMEGQKPGESYYRIRVGDWRIGVEYINPDITLLRLLSRGTVYKNFPPK
ncbi:type II toxin-antitoxin system RelE family toxin [Dyadobacter frigoris]|uniref:Type II toxin-antitoxin system RelE/ParE family toxin n=1 Tax=Dyadobacter frigoris TaxID=2576211 RepID=A0A4U6D9T7_9BACT|nr:type II toxin-antitoxin system RelE/ParE family toxin [Dyadobacter frigoris]TKT92938.1 type II toxin-antitoxin system RelE/ParE family toxin [Dyadobacter frigoris]GLU54276.1 toxin RelE [Dyadobacter frigoris]